MQLIIAHSKQQRGRAGSPSAVLEMSAVCVCGMSHYCEGMHTEAAVNLPLYSHEQFTLQPEHCTGRAHRCLTLMYGQRMGDDCAQADAARAVGRGAHAARCGGHSAARRPAGAAALRARRRRGVQPGCSDRHFKHLQRQRRAFCCACIQASLLARQ